MRFTWKNIIIILIAVVTVYCWVYPSISASFRYLFGPRRELNYADWIPPYDPDNEDDGIDMHGPHIFYTPDIHGASVRALFDELFEVSEDYVPRYPYEVQGLPHPKPTKRYDFEFNKVACWQDNGVWIAKLSPVEMASLGVDRFHESDRALDQAEEDKFCFRLRMYGGANFWTLPPKWPQTLLWCETIECIEPDRRGANFEVGFPSTGGVYVLAIENDEQLSDADRVTLRNTLSMDERSQVIKELGGVFCQDLHQCPALDHLMGKAVNSDPPKTANILQ